MVRGSKSKKWREWDFYRGIKKFLNDYGGWWLPGSSLLKNITFFLMSEFCGV